MYSNFHRPSIYPTPPEPFPLHNHLALPRPFAFSQQPPSLLPLCARGRQVRNTMAVQGRFLPYDLHAVRSIEGSAPPGALFFDEYGGCAPAFVGVGNTVLSDLPHSELSSNDNYGFVPRKRARAAAAAGPAGVAGCAQQRVVLQQAALTHGLVLPGDAQSCRVLGSAAASTSGRMPNATGLSQGLMSQLYNQGVEMDALLRLESERMRAGLEEARQRHARAVLATVERAAAGRLRAAEAELERARYRNAELEERLRQMSAEGQAWLGVAKNNEAVAVGLRATLDQLLQSPCAIAGAVEGEAEDAQSCCFETPACATDYAASRAVPGAASCKVCGEGEACVLLLPCRHLSLCRACEAGADTCPVCAATKNASLHVLLS